MDWGVYPISCQWSLSVYPLKTSDVCRDYVKRQVTRNRFKSNLEAMTSNRVRRQLHGVLIHWSEKSEFEKFRRTYGRRNKVTCHNGFLTVKWENSLSKELIKHLTILHCGKFFAGCGICGLCLLILKLHWAMKLANQVFNITYFVFW